MGTSVKVVGGAIQHAVTIDPQAKEIRIAYGIAVVIDDGLYDCQRWCDIIVGNGTYCILALDQSDTTIRGAVSTPGAWLVTTNPRL